MKCISSAKVGIDELPHIGLGICNGLVDHHDGVVVGIRDVVEMEGLGRRRMEVQQRVGRGSAPMECRRSFLFATDVFSPRLIENVGIYLCTRQQGTRRLTARTSVYNCLMFLYILGLFI